MSLAPRFWMAALAACVALSAASAGRAAESHGRAHLSSAVDMTSTGAIAQPPPGPADVPGKPKPAQMAALSGIVAADLVADANRGVLTLALDHRVEISAFTLADPYRVVVDLPEVTFAANAGSREPTGLVTSWRAGLFMTGRSRLVLSTTGPVRIARSEIAETASGASYTLEFETVDKAGFVSGVGKVAATRRDAAGALVKADREAQRAPEKKSDGKLIVVLDPGHGGLDVGTRSPATGMQEKIVTLEFAQIVKAKLEATGRYSVVLTRTEDVFIALAERVKFARQHHADVFVSIHVDAELDHSVRGATVYTVAEKSSDDAAEALAAKENASDSLTGLVPEDSADQVSDILVDLARRETLIMNHALADVLVGGMSSVSRMTKGGGHRSAGFRVLKAYDVPSALVELGFLSNKEDESLLMSPAWREKTATALVGAIDRFFADRNRAAQR